MKWSFRHTFATCIISAAVITAFCSFCGVFDNVLGRSSYHRVLIVTESGREIEAIAGSVTMQRGLVLLTDVEANGFNYSELFVMSGRVYVRDPK